MPRPIHESIRWVKGIDPVADAFTATVYSDVVSMKDNDAVVFLVYKGVATGATATATLTVQACDDFTPSNRTAVPFRYRRSCNSADAQGALTAATATGFATTAGSSEIYEVFVRKEDVVASGYANVQLKSVEGVDDPVVGCILIGMLAPNYAEDIARTVIS
jgi:hypothetical protein